LDLVKATLHLAKIGLDGDETFVSRSELILNLMKIYMLEHGQQTPTNTSQSDIFRDAEVSSLIKGLLDRPVKPLPVTRTHVGEVFEAQSRDTETDTKTKSLEEAALSFLGPDIPFYQFFTDFVGLYESISFADPTFTRFLFVPMAMSYPVDFRRLIWCEHPSIIRGIRTKASEVPIESDAGLKAWFEPIESDDDVLGGMVRAFVRGWVREETFIWQVAIWHLAKVVWNQSEDASKEEEKRRKDLLTGILGASDAAVRAVMLNDNGDVAARTQVVQKLLGDRAVQRISRMGL
jgi:hypothetical protein